MKYSWRPEVAGFHQIRPDQKGADSTSCHVSLPRPKQQQQRQIGGTLGTETCYLFLIIHPNQHGLQAARGDSRPTTWLMCWRVQFRTTTSSIQLIVESSNNNCTVTFKIKSKEMQSDVISSQRPPHSGKRSAWRTFYLFLPSTNRLNVLSTNQLSLVCFQY